ncbi:MAG: hypothetical protein EAX87_02175 [Candidatus Thorarchaeota archaeon]|nr:hypothetical protein [Candidatus Thorarchaeota archaeon]
MFFLLAQMEYTITQWAAAISIVLFLFGVILWVIQASRDSETTESIKERKPISQPAIQKEREVKQKKTNQDKENIRVLRGGTFVGNRFRFKVKVVNESQYTITDVRVYLVSYPRDALNFDADDDDVYFAKIEPGGFRSPTFDFIPTLDCVKGDIIAGVTYVDTRGEAHTQTTQPLVIRAVCDLLIPEEISPEEFGLKVRNLRSGELTVEVDEWTPEEMFEKSQYVLKDANFHDVSSKTSQSDNTVMAYVEGWARGKYTDKGVGVRLHISGQAGKKGASCTIRVSGEDSALVLPAIEDLRNRLCTWLCPVCKSTLSVVNVKEIKKGIAIECPYCGATIGK